MGEFEPDQQNQDLGLWLPDCTAIGTQEFFSSDLEEMIKLDNNKLAILKLSTVKWTMDNNKIDNHKKIDSK